MGGCMAAGSISETGQPVGSAGKARRIREHALEAAARQDWHAAERLWRRCIEEFPKDAKPGWYSGQAAALRQLGRHDEARALDEVLRKRWPTNPLGWTRAALDATARKDWPAAEQWWKECIERFPNSITANWYASLASCLQQLGRTADAQGAYHLARQCFADSPKGWIGEARIATEQGEWEKAEGLWRECIARFSESNKAQWYSRLAYTLQQQGRFLDAEQALADSDACLLGQSVDKLMPVESESRISIDACDGPDPTSLLPQASPSLVFVVVSHKRGSGPQAVSFVRSTIEQRDEFRVVVDTPLGEALKANGVVAPERIRVIDCDLSVAPLGSDILARIAAAVGTCEGFIYLEAGVNPASLASLGRFACAPADLHVFGAAYPCQLTRRMPGVRGRNTSTGSIGIDLFHLLYPSNILIFTSLLTRIVSNHEVALAEVGAAALQASRNISVHDVPLAGDEQDEVRRVQSLVSCYSSFLTTEPEIAARILDFVANPLNCRSLLLNRHPAAEMLIAQFSAPIKGLARQLRARIPIQFQTEWIDAIVNADRSQLLELVARIEKNRFPRLNSRQSDFSSAERPLPTSIRSSQAAQHGVPAAAPEQSPSVTLDYGATVEGSFGKHRDGWNFVLQNLLARIPHDPNSPGLDAFVDKTFAWEYGSEIALRKKNWIGITHKPPGIPSFLGWKTGMQFYQSPYFLPHARSLKALITVEESHARFLQTRFDIPVYSIVHPTNFDVPRWSPECLDLEPLRIVQIGKWLRRFHSIFLLPKGPYRKCILAGSRKRLFSGRMFIAEGLELQRRGEASIACYDSVEIIDYLDDAAYDRLLQSSIVFLDLFASTANNTVLECIARQTPIIVNRLPATIQYLGSDYPLLFDSLSEAAGFAADRSRLLAAHHHLVRWSARPEFRVETFADEISRITKAIAAHQC